jgi:hypothetical protein
MSIVNGYNSFWSTPFRYSYWEDFPFYAKELSKVVEDQHYNLTSNIDSVSIAGLDEGLTTKWYAYNFLDSENDAVKKLRTFIFDEVRNFMIDLNHEDDNLLYQSWANLLQNQDVLKTHSHAGPYSYLSGVFYVKTIASSTKYFSPIERRIPGVEDFYETEIEVENVEGGLVLFPSFIEHCSTPTLENTDRITIAFDVLKESPVDRFHNSFNQRVISKFE